MRHWILVVILAALGCSQQQQGSATRGTITLMATESLAPLIQREAEEFHRLYPEANVTVLSTSTRDAIVSLFNDSVKLVIVDRPLNTEEQEVAKKANLDVVRNRIAVDALAVIVNSRNNLEHTSLDTLENIFNRTLSTWNRISGSRTRGSIELVMTGRNSGAYELLMSHFFTFSKSVVPDYVAPTQAGVLRYTATHTNALGVVSLAALDTTGQPGLQELKSSVRVLALRGKDSVNNEGYMKLHQANVYRALYPLHYPVYVYTTASSASVAAGFSAFIASAPGQKIFLKSGLVPATMPVRLVQTTQEQLPQ